MQHSVAPLHQGAPGRMTRLDDPPPWLRPAPIIYLFYFVYKSYTKYRKKHEKKRKTGEQSLLRDNTQYAVLCFGNFTENKNVTICDRFICFILTTRLSAVLAACVLRATIKKG